MLEIRTSPDSFVVFDTDDDAPVMRFDSRDEAVTLIVELVEAETLESSQTFDLHARVRHLHTPAYCQR